MTKRKNNILPNPLDEGQLYLGWVELLYEIIRQFASTLDLDEVLGTVLSMTVQSVGANEGSIFLLDNQGWVKRSILARGNVPPEVKFPVLVTVMSKGFAGWVFQNRRADIIQDTKNDPRWVPLTDDPHATRSVIGVPLVRREQIVGILTLTHPKPNVFTSWHLELLNAIARQAAAAIENAQLYTQANNERQMLQAILGSVQEAIIVADLRDRIIFWNAAAQQSLGLTENARNKPLKDILAEDALLFFYQTAEGERRFKQVALNDGRYFECSLIRVPNIGKVLAMHDITTFKKLDALKSEFVSHVSHDLKNPLMLIGGYAALLEEDLEGTSAAHAGTITQTVERMREFIDDLLDLSRIEMGIEAEFKPIDMNGVMLASVTNMQALAMQNDIALITKQTDSELIVKGSPVRLGQAISNLVGNALKFTPGGGKITTCTSMEEGLIVVRVADTGPGIPPVLQGKLFQKFSKLGQDTTRGGEGHGLGLAIVRSVVEAHGGRVWVESQVGEGSVFAFGIPAYQEKG
ncbi:MAG: GAF domain-containing protein [Anaerolineales bacterium]|nr:GAF domain-containing protein [Anaerolineales bacterium]